MSVPPLLSTRAPRKDGEDSRERLLQAGLRLFAHQGYSKTSTRELAEAASVNVAAISYYFGDKAGLYRAVCFEPMGSHEEAVVRFGDPGLGLAQALAAYYERFLDPLRQGEVARLCMRLHFREMLEPTGLWDQEVVNSIKPVHDALVVLLCRHLGLAKADDALRRLAVCLAALGVHLHVSGDVIEHLAPSLARGDAAVDRWSHTLVVFGLAMVEAERQRRAAAKSKRKA